MKKIISILLLNGLVLSCLSGCALLDPQTPNPTETPTEAPTESQIDDMAFKATYIAYRDGTTNGANLKIQILDGEIYINDTLCEKVEKVSNPITAFGEDMVFGLKPPGTEISELLEKIENCKSCYTMETQIGLIQGEKTAVYDIDGAYYFVMLYDNVPYAVYAPVELFDTTADSSSKIFYERLAGGLQVKNPSDRTHFAAITVAQLVALSWAYNLKVCVIEGKIYLNDVLYENKGQVTNPITAFDFDMEGMGNMRGSERVSNALEKILNSESCYILEAEDYVKYGEQIAVYDIDGVCYFIAIYNSVAYRIHGAAFFDN